MDPLHRPNAFRFGWIVWGLLAIILFSPGYRTANPYFPVWAGAAFAQEAPPPVRVHAMGFDQIAAGPAADPGPGVVVCDPVASSSLHDFGVGCGRWLYLYTGGQPEFGRTAYWIELDRARRELHKPDLALRADEAGKIGSILGATYVACGTLEGTAAKATLTYRLQKIFGNQPVGGPIVLRGSLEELTAALPGVARTLATRLGANSPQVPQSVALSPEDVARLGSLTWKSSPILTQAQADWLKGLDDKSSLAAIYDLQFCRWRNEPAREQIARRLLAQAGANPLVLYFLGQVTPVSLNGLGQVNGQVALKESPDAQRPAWVNGLCGPLTNALVRSPLSVAVVSAALRVKRMGPDSQIAFLLAEKCAHVSPDNPETWLLLANTIDTAVERVRQSRTWDDMSSEDQDYVQQLYALWLKCTLRAVHLDPLSAHAWFRVATAATFAGDGAVADDAFWKAMRLGPPDLETLWWGMEMYQPKWLDRPDRLRAVVQAACTASYESPGMAVAVARALQSHGYDARARTLLDRVATEQRRVLASKPDDLAALSSLGEVAQQEGNTAEAVQLLDRFIRLLPGNERVVQYRNLLHSSLVNPALRQ